MLAASLKKEGRKEGRSSKPGSNYSDGDLHSLKAKIPNHRERERERGPERAQSISMRTKDFQKVLIFFFWIK